MFLKKVLHSSAIMLNIIVLLSVYTTFTTHDYKSEPLTLANYSQDLNYLNTYNIHCRLHYNAVVGVQGEKMRYKGPIIHTCDRCSKSLTRPLSHT